MRYLNYFLATIKVLLALQTIISGIITLFIPITSIEGPLGLLYSTRVGLVIFGLIVIASGTALLLGKILRKSKLTGQGLMAVYMCYLFAAIIQGIAFDWEPSAWVANAVFAAISAALWVWWKMKTQYINPAVFRKQVRHLHKR